MPEEEFMKKVLFIALFLICAGSLLFSADNRFALVIGNGNYRDRNISALANPVNDATDVAASLNGLGYDVTLKTNVNLREMIDAIEAFSFNLRRSPDSEGFFWFAGHGLSVRGIHYLLPVDVDPVNDNIIARGSYSVDDLMEEIGTARNRTNLVVIDACRNTLLPGGNRSVGTRGLTVLSADDYRVAGNKIVYSTMAGRTAADGVPGSRNSPFAQAFISNINKPESFDDVFLDIANDTMLLTRGDQQPYAMGSFAVKSYSIYPLQVIAAAPQGAVEAQARPLAPQPLPVQPARDNRSRESTKDLRFWSIGGSAGTCFADPWVVATIRGTIAPINYSFLELGVDAGFVSGERVIKFSYSITPFAHLAFYMPLGQIVGVYAGAGGSFMFASYSIFENWYNSNIFAMDVVTGINLFSKLDISYTFKTNFKRVGNKLSVGYTYRF